MRGVKEVSNVGKWGQAALQNSSRALMCTSVCLSARPKNHTCVPSAKLIYLINQHQWVAATCGLQTLHHLAWHCTYICAPVVQKEQMSVVLEKRGSRRAEGGVARVEKSSSPKMVEDGHIYRRPPCCTKRCVGTQGTTPSFPTRTHPPHT